MTPAYLRQLQYMTERKSYASIARETNMPMSMLRSVVAEKRDLPAEYKNDVRNAYRRVAYSSLKETGFSARNAGIWSTYRPESVNVVASNVKLKIAELTTGALGQWVKTTDELVTQRMINEKWDEIYNDIKRGFQASKLSIQEQLDY